MANPLDSTNPPPQGFVYSLKRWGENSFNPMILAALIAPQHLRPLHPVGGIVLPAGLIFGSFMSLHGYKKDAAGFVAAQSGLYILLASRRRWRVKEKLSPRGMLRGATLALCALDLVSGGIAYTFGDRNKEAELRKENE